MKEWTVEISGDGSDLEELSKSLSQTDLNIQKENDKYYLNSVDFNELNDPNGVKSTAEEKLVLINGAARLALGMRKPIEIETVIEIRPDGNRIPTRFLADTLYASAITSFTVRRSNGTVEEYRPADPVPDWIRLAQQDANIAAVLKLLGKKHDWVNLYRIYEVVKYDTQGESFIVQNGWTTASQIERFRRTANSVTAAGDQARHGVEITEPPANPMQLSEAQSFIRSLLFNWLRQKQTSMP